MVFHCVHPVSRFFSLASFFSQETSVLFANCFAQCLTRPCAFFADFAAILWPCRGMMSSCRCVFCVLKTPVEDILQNEGPRALFRGLESTLWRDVPFSAFYWLGVEVVREKFLQRGISVVKRSSCEEHRGFIFWGKHNNCSTF